MKSLPPSSEAETISPISQMRNLRLSEVKYFDHRDLEVQGQNQESNPSLLHGLCFPPKSRHVPPPCSALHPLEAAPGPLHGLMVSPDTTQRGLNMLHVNAAAAAAAKSLQSCPTLWNPIDSSPPGSPVPGILQARTLEWVAIFISNA